CAVPIPQSSGRRTYCVLPSNNGVLDYSDNGYVIQSTSPVVHYNLADVNGDSFPDIITFERDAIGDYHIYSYNNTGSNGIENNFDPVPANLNYGSGAPTLFEFSELLAGDIDNDGDDDIAFGQGQGSFHWVLLQDGGSFTSVQTTDNFVAGNEYVDLIDLNGNGFLEVLVYSSGFEPYLSWHPVDGTGLLGIGDLIHTSGNYTGASQGNTMEEPWTFARDVDSDGDVDVVTLTNRLVHWYENRGNGTFENPKLFSKLTTFQAVYTIEDVNNDGIYDMIAKYGDEIRLFLRFANGTEQEILLGPDTNEGRIAIGDYEGDGDLDILSDGYINDGSGNFSVESDLEGVFPNRRFQYEDLNGDNILDSYRVTDPGSGFPALEILVSNGLYSYTEQVVFEQDNNNNYYYAVNFEDINIDGQKDVVFVVRELGPDLKMYVSYNQGNGNFSQATEYLVVGPENDFVEYRFYQDIDYNGRFDLILFTDDDILYRLQNTDGTFEPLEVLFDETQVCINRFDSVKDLIFGDLDGDMVNDYLVVSELDISWIGNNFNIDPLTLDYDGDGVFNVDEDLNGNGDPSDDDTDGDGIPNYYDTDDDDDTVATNDEITGIGAGDQSGTNFIDTDNDGVENYLDADDDGDNTLTVNEDYNGNGDPIDDDTNSNGIPDFLDPEVFILSAGDQEFGDRFTVSPNPFTRGLSITFFEELSDVSLRLFDIHGRVLLTYQETTAAERIELTVPELAQGVYWLEITSEEKMAVKKLLRR
ncbi:MAG: FG-GAP-like repeat-containing protein, partial [Bacteroidota bacterium]